MFYCEEPVYYQDLYGKISACATLISYSHKDGHLFRTHSPLLVKKRVYMMGSKRMLILDGIVPPGSLVYCGKDCFNSKGDSGNTLAKRKMRVSKLIPIGIKNKFIYTEADARAKFDTARSSFDPNFFYNLGVPATPRLPFSLSSNQCTSGIHGFINEQDAFNH